MTLPSTVELVEAASIRKRGGADIDLELFRTRFARRRLVQLSLPVFSSDGTRALVFTWTSAGFDDSSGGGYVFQRQQGRWVIVDYLARWIT